MVFLHKILNFIFKTIFFLYRKNKLRLALINGMNVGKNSKFIGIQDFGSEPYLIKIGNQCLITDGVRFINHDGGIQVPFIKTGEDIDNIYGKKSIFGKIEIGDNVFIGSSSLILMDTYIGDNTIIAAGSIVKGTFPPNCIIGGIPARIISDIESYHAKNDSKLIIFSENESSQLRKKKIIKILD
ncbi:MULTISPECIES: acyltransferase [Photorhabdus]|uniref:Acetyltransferase n=2 Tax=Photorhabdus asymbiotica TaxID=291112 RepID=C7BSC0_PHOAA|nr:acyltransferase [Photorhabdus asymbiotica]RKS60245.1 succinyltransferase-like protein [Photorhabdus asymbiotica]CAQ86418.1 acetyltransferase [Photorhabdus asymbiotica]